MKYALVILFQVMVMLTGNGMTQTIDPSLQSDIEIMESIMDRLFEKDRGEFRFFTGRTRGFCLDGYGMLFKVPYSRPGGIPDVIFEAEKNFEKVLMHLKEEESEIIVKKKEKRSDGKSDEELGKIKQKIARFLGDYASALTTLKPDQWVSIIVDFNGSMMPFHDGRITQLRAKVGKKDIDAYRSHQISQDKFVAAIQYHSVYEPDTEADEQIDIFSDIIRSSFEESEKPRSLHFSDKIRGFYIDGYGLLFTFTADFRPNYFTIVKQRPGREDLIINTSDDSVDYNANFEYIEKRVTGVLSRFGHTLKVLNADDWVEIAIEIEDQTPEADYSKMIMKTKKREIDQWNSRAIDLNEFRRRIRVVKY